MQIINRSLLRELTTNALAVAFIFVALFMVVSLVKILAKAAAGSFPAKFIFIMLGLQTVEILSLMLPLAFYIGLLITLGRWYQDNEMTVLAACGVGLAQLLRPVLLIAAGFAVVVALLAFYLAPVASRLMAQIKQDETSRYETAAITPGVFNEITRSDKAQEGGVYYIENIDPGGEMHKVFVATRHADRQGVLVAKAGREVTDAESGDRFLVLDNGVRYDGTPGCSCSNAMPCVSSYRHRCCAAPRITRCPPRSCSPNGNAPRLSSSNAPPMPSCTGGWPSRWHCCCLRYSHWYLPIPNHAGVATSACSWRSSLISCIATCWVWRMPCSSADAYQLSWGCGGCMPCFWCLAPISSGGGPTICRYCQCRRYSGGARHEDP
jgi:hypothetical protein